jgi:hypothetical protein
VYATRRAAVWPDVEADFWPLFTSFPALHCKYLINTTSRHAKEAPSWRRQAHASRLTPTPHFRFRRDRPQARAGACAWPKEGVPLGSSRTCANHANGQPLASILLHSAHSCWISNRCQRRSVSQLPPFLGRREESTCGPVALWSLGSQSAVLIVSTLHLFWRPQIAVYMQQAIHQYWP